MGAFPPLGCNTCKFECAHICWVLIDPIPFVDTRKLSLLYAGLAGWDSSHNYTGTHTPPSTGSPGLGKDAGMPN